MVVIRMQRAGGKNRPAYRVVVADSRFQRDGRFLEKLGYYDPLKSPARFHIEVERADYWVSKGARPSDAVTLLIKKAKAQAKVAAVAN